MKSPYINGAEALPPELLAQVQPHCTGLVWIPVPNTFFAERRELVVSLKARGVTAVEIARLAGVSRRRVNQILAQEKESRADNPRPASGK